MHKFEKFHLLDGFTDELVERIEARQANKRAASEELDGTPRKRERNMVWGFSQRYFSMLMPGYGPVHR